MLSEVGVGFRGGNNTSRGDQALWVQSCTHVTKCPVDLPLQGKSISQQPGGTSWRLLSIRKANSHREPRGEWLRVTKELPSEGPSELPLTPGCRPGRGKWEQHDRVQGWPE